MEPALPTLPRSILAHKGTAVCAIALDTKGPEIRTGTMKNGVDSVSVEAGSTVEVTTDPAYKSQCTATHIYVDYEDLCETVTPGMTIFIAPHRSIWKPKLSYSSPAASGPGGFAKVKV